MCYRLCHSGLSGPARASPRWFGVSESFAIKLVKHWREEGHIEPRYFGRPADRGKPRHYKNTLHKVLKQEPDITLSELCVQLSERHGVNIHPGNPGPYPGFLGYTYKKKRWWPRNVGAQM